MPPEPIKHRLQNKNWSCRKKRIKFSNWLELGIFFWFTFIVNLCRHFFCDFQKMVYIYRHVSDKSKNCLSVGNSVNLSVWYIDVPDVTAIYGTPFDFIAFFWVFSYILLFSCLKYCIFIKFSQIVYLINTHVLIC